MSEILAGPALRHTDIYGAHIWIVLDHSANNIDVEVYDQNNNRIGHVSPQSQEPVKLGESLYFYLLKAVAHEDAFRFNTKYYYDINIDGKRLESFGLTNSDKPITYPNEPLPSFFIPALHKNTMHAACRKPHASAGDKNVFDKIRSADDIIGDNIAELDKRPSRILLTGDQIYADDVSIPMLVLVEELAVKLTGIKEELPPPASGQNRVIPADIKLGARKTIINKDIGFTTGEGEQHLISFGEYIVMYLLVWGGLTKHIEYKNYDAVKHQFAKTNFFTKRRYKRNLKIIQTFLDNSWQFRRVMANTPSYMIFDDHDVTDDWNLRENIADLLKENPLSRRVVSNALAAFWACQAWGNDPQRFAGIKEQLALWYGQKIPGADKTLEQTLLDQYWGYTVATTPALIVLDTRTQRYLKGNEFALMNDQAMDWLKRETTLLGQAYAGKSIILVSATPVFGFTPIEMVQIKIFKMHPVGMDVEPWIANKRSLEQLKKNLSLMPSVEHILICSGDVHYAFHRLEKDTQTVSGRTINYWQLTSTSTCNIPLGKKGRKIFSSLDSIVVWFQRNCLKAAKWALFNLFGIAILNHWLADKLRRYIDPRIEDKAFHRKKTRYLVPKEEQNQKKADFISADTNIGLIQVDNDGPTISTLHLGNEENAYIWTYDLRDPQEHI